MFSAGCGFFPTYDSISECVSSIHACISQTAFELKKKIKKKAMFVMARNQTWEKKLGRSLNSPLYHQHYGKLHISLQTQHFFTLKKHGGMKERFFLKKGSVGCVAAIYCLLSNSDKNAYCLNFFNSSTSFSSSRDSQD